MLQVSCIIVMISLLYVGNASGFLDFRPISVRREKESNREMGNRLHAVPDFISIVQRFGYPAEEYKVQTPDGYLVRVHRIPGSQANPKASGKPVVYIQHGILASSDMFVIGGPDHDLAYMLADAGYDVWLGNARGNSYSRSHTQISPQDPDFWQFSFHEIAIYDVSTMIDFILHETNQESLIYVAHSMGTTIGLVLLSTKPEYNQKISLVINLATIGNWNKPRNLMKVFYHYGYIVDKILTTARIGEVLPQTLGGGQILNNTCHDGSIFQQICSRMIHFVSGYDPELMDNKLLTFGLLYYPAGASTQTLRHFYQNIVAGKLQMFDYGYIRNFATYRQIKPPAYNLKNIDTPVYMFVGKGDAVAPPEDSMELKSLIKQARVEIVPHNNFNHLDFVWAKNLKHLLQNRILEIIDRSSKNVQFKLL